MRPSASIFLVGILSFLAVWVEVRVSMQASVTVSVERSHGHDLVEPSITFFDPKIMAAKALQGNTTLTLEESHGSVEQKSISFDPKKMTSIALQGSTTFNLEENHGSVEQKSITFDPNLTAEDYLKMTPTRPTRQWLDDCATTLAKDKSVMRPFPAKIPRYRLGDCIKRCRACYMGIPSQKNTTERQPWRHFPEDYNLTIAGYYNNLACNTQDMSNYSLVHNILETHFASRPGFVKPNPNDIVIHLRLGDVVESSRETVTTLLTEGGVGYHPELKKSQLKSTQSVYYYLDQLLAYPNNTIVMVGGSHWRQLFRKSRGYATCLQRGLALAGRKVELNMDGGDADQDFFFNSYAKKYMMSTGGYSRIMGKMAVMHGGEIIGDRLDFDILD
jgi:hypothetical protein